MESLWIGYTNGDFFLVDLLTSEPERQFFKPPPKSAVLVWSISHEHGTIRNENLFFDVAGHLLARRPAPGPLYDPRLRTWYQQAMQASGQTGTTSPDATIPLVTGLTFAEKTPNGQAVVGGGLNLERITSTLQEELPSPDSELAILSPKGALLTTARSQEPTVTQMAMGLAPSQSPIITKGLEAYSRNRRGRFTETDSSGRTWVVSLDEINLLDELHEVLLLALPRDEILTTATTFIHRSMLVTAGLMLVCVPLTWLAIRRISTPLGTLATEMRNIQNHYLEKSDYLNSKVTEIQELAQGLTAIQKEVQKLLHLLAAINAEPDFPRLLETVIRETTSLTDADGGLVVLLDKKTTASMKARPAGSESP